jgi:hypothetical protein
VQKNTLLRAHSKKTLLNTIAYLWPELPQLADHPYLSIHRVGPKTRPRYYKLILDSQKLNEHVLHKNLPPAPKKQRRVHPCGRVQGEYNPDATRGTYRIGDHTRWRARRSIGGKVTNLGAYETRAEAAIAYQLYEDTGNRPSKERVKALMDTLKAPTVTIEDCF